VQFNNFFLNPFLFLEVISYSQKVMSVFWIVQIMSKMTFWITHTISKEKKVDVFI